MDFDEGVLDHFFGVASVVEHLEGQFVGQRMVLAHQFVERLGVAADDAADALLFARSVDFELWFCGTSHRPFVIYRHRLGVFVRALQMVMFSRSAFAVADREGRCLFHEALIL